MEKTFYRIDYGDDWWIILSKNLGISINVNTMSTNEQALGNLFTHPNTTDKKMKSVYRMFSNSRALLGSKDMFRWWDKYFKSITKNFSQLYLWTMISFVDNQISSVKSKLTILKHSINTTPPPFPLLGKIHTDPT